MKCSFTMSKPSGGIRSLHSLSAWGLPTPIVALACIGNVGIQAFSGVCGRLLFLRRLQDKPPLKGEGDQRSWWRGSVESFTSVSGFTEESLSQPAAASSLFKGA